MLLIPIILAVIFFWFIGQSNKLNRYVVSIEESKKTVDITLVKRYDTISEMLKVAKAYAKHEELSGSSFFSAVFSFAEGDCFGK